MTQNHRPSKARDRLRRFLARAADNTSGVAAIEFGIVVPLLALLVIAVIDLGLGIYAKMQVEDSAQAGVEWAIKNGFDTNLITAAVTNATSNTGVSASPAPNQFCGCAAGSAITAATCGSTCTGGAAAATYVTVSAQATYTTMISYPIFPSSYNFSIQSTARLQ